MSHKPLAAIAVLGAGLCAVSSSAWACGDKLLLLASAVRFQSRHTPHAAAVLLYVPDPARGALVDPKLESALTEAGHKLRIVGTEMDLALAVRSGRFDVVLADLADAHVLQRNMRSGPGAPVVLPALYLFAPTGQSPAKPQTRADASRASLDFGTVLKVPGRPGQYCAAVDKAMAFKLKRDRSKPHAQRAPKE
jgi:hypothetical protein